MYLVISELLRGWCNRVSCLSGSICMCVGSMRVIVNNSTCTSARNKLQPDVISGQNKAG